MAVKVWNVRGRWSRPSKQPKPSPSQRPFDTWYAPGGSGSGPGSAPSFTAEWRAFLEAFLAEHDINTILDFGCGDWQSSRLLDWGDRLYFGVDVVPDLIARLKAEFGSATRLFLLVDPLRPLLPDADLVICKDVLQHLPNATITRLLPLFGRYRHGLLVNDKCSNPAANNRDTRLGGFRCLDVARPPFSLRAVDVFRFGTGSVVKTAQWIQNPAAEPITLPPPRVELSERRK